MASGLSTATQFFLCSNTNGLQAISTSNVSKSPKEVAGMMRNYSCVWAGNIILMMEVRKKILTFRDTIDLPPCDGSGPIHELIMGTLEDLHKLYPTIVPCNLTSEITEVSICQGLANLCNALKSIGDSWAKNHKWITSFKDNKEDIIENVSLEQLGQRVLGKLDYMINVARELFDVMDEDEKNNDDRTQGTTFGDVLTESYSDKKFTCPSPDTLTSVPPELTSYTPPLLLPLRLQAIGKLRPADTKFNLFNTFPHISAQVSSPTKEINKTADVPKVEEIREVAKELPAKIIPPPSLPPPTLLSSTNLTSNATAVPCPPPIPPSIGLSAMPPPPMPMTKGALPPPPPPLGVAKALRPKKANTKLKRSTHMGNLYRSLKGKVEGSSLHGKKSREKKSQIGGSAAGKQGMADALAEMTKRSAYFQQIEEDVQKHAKSIMELKSAITSFQTKDMVELLNFHKNVEQQLEKLTDETQVLARFEGFPTKKLESLRTAAALYTRLKSIHTNLENWKVAPPLGQLLDKVEAYFNKIKGDLDALERTKDEESKRFQSQNIHFEFNILIQIKESMVDVSSSCMELALKERRDTKAATSKENDSKTDCETKTCIKMLWRAFQFAFRVYSFAGGQDDRAERLSRELADEINTDPPQE